MSCARTSRAPSQVEFLWGGDTDTARPDAWCRQCEDALVALAGDSTERWFLDGAYKVLCAGCWDEAKEGLYERG